ncbi:MAG: hypothetical protein AB1671_22535 [Thermodesulfobacteriota bacterium]|jgi:uncharacterized protein (DUF983 family)
MAYPPPTVLPAGTILSCPECGEGLYKLTQRSTVRELVFEDRTRLVPLNRTIPPRTAARALATCPLCGGRYFKHGRVHTFQYGWR